jgi:hypothetical protein
MQIRKKGDEIKKKDISIFSHGAHLGYRMALTDTILKGDHTKIISAKLVEIGSVVSEEKKFFSFHSPFPWVVPFQKCVRQRRPASNVAFITKNRKFFK